VIHAQRGMRAPCCSRSSPSMRNWFNRFVSIQVLPKGPES
jgi:hypothetical protein